MSAAAPVKKEEAPKVTEMKKFIPFMMMHSNLQCLIRTSLYNYLLTTKGKSIATCGRSPLSFLWRPRLVYDPSALKYSVVDEDLFRLSISTGVTYSPKQCLPYLFQELLKCPVGCLTFVSLTLVSCIETANHRWEDCTDGHACLLIWERTKNGVELEYFDPNGGAAYSGGAAWMNFASITAVLQTTFGGSAPIRITTNNRTAQGPQTLMSQSNHEWNGLCGLYTTLYLFNRLQGRGPDAIQEQFTADIEHDSWGFRADMIDWIYDVIDHIKLPALGGVSLMPWIASKFMEHPMYQVFRLATALKWYILSSFNPEIDPEDRREFFLPLIKKQMKAIDIAGTTEFISASDRASEGIREDALEIGKAPMFALEHLKDLSPDQLKSVTARCDELIDTTFAAAYAVLFELTDPLMEKVRVEAETKW